MKSCVFFGHRSFDYSPYKKQIENIIMDLIKSSGVTEFYNGFRGDFDVQCAQIVHNLKAQFDNISLINVLSYIPNEDYYIPKLFDGSIYLLEEKVPQRFAISHTNRLIVEKADYIISGVFLSFGGAYAAVRHAERLHKNIIKIKYIEQ